MLFIKFNGALYYWVFTRIGYLTILYTSSHLLFADCYFVPFKECKFSLRMGSKNNLWHS